jgi:hypothetical protein
MTTVTTRRRWHLPGQAQGWALLAWCFLSLIYPLADTDFWWHLKTGQQIAREGAVPLIDQYTFTDADKPWIDLHWGFQLLVAWLFSAGGVNAVILAKAVVITAAVAFAWGSTLRQLPPWLGALCWVLPVVCISGRGYERPEMLSLLFLAGWLAVAQRAERSPRLIWLLPVVQLIWVNCHALFALGLVVGCCFALDRLLRAALAGRVGWFAPPPLQPSPRALGIVAVLAAAAAFVNPYFEEGALFPLTLYRKFSVDQAFYATRVGEFTQPLAFIRRYGLFSNLYLVAELLVWLAAAGSFIWLLARRGRLSPFRLLLFAAFTHLAWEASRNTNIFALVAGYVTCANLAEHVSVREPAGVAGTAGRVASWATLTLLAALAAAVVSGQWNRWGQENKPFSLGERRNWFLHGAARMAGRPGMPGLAFVQNFGQAAVYIYHNGPERRVFMDGRLEVCSRKTFEMFDSICLSMARGSRAWENLFTGSGVELPAVLLDVSRGTAPMIAGMLNTPGWRLVYADDAGTLFLEEARARRLNLPAVDPKDLAGALGRQGIVIMRQ